MALKDSSDCRDGAVWADGEFGVEALVATPGSLRLGQTGYRGVHREMNRSMFNILTE